MGAMRLFRYLVSDAVRDDRFRRFTLSRCGDAFV